MVCALCLSVQRLSPETPREVDGAGQAEVPRGTCERCGRALDGDALERMTAKLAQLGRFGLTGRPLLARRRA
jgi:hypothetical protein